MDIEKQDGLKMREADCNSLEYWNERFSSGSWDHWQGEKQSQFFARVAVEALPERIRRMLEENAWTLIDYGCAEGAGTAFIASQFPALNVTGVDFSEEAIRKAEKSYPQCSFEVGDVTAELKEVDVAFSSNTLEHLRNPRAVLENLAKSARKATILLLPFEDDSNAKEHFNIFHTGFFPAEIGGCCLSYFNIIDCRDIPGTHWAGKQILLVYVPGAKDTGLSMNELYRDWLAKLVDQPHMLRQELAQQREQHADELKKMEREYTDVVTAFIRQKESETFTALSRMMTISHSKPYRLAHYAVEAAHAFFGNKEDRILGKQYLFKSRKTITRYNYMDEMRAMVRRIGDTGTLKDIQNRKGRMIIRQILRNYPGRDVYVMPVLIDWNVPLFQRPQQIAMGLAHHGALFIYLTTNYLDNVDDPTFLENNLVLAKRELLPSIFQIAEEEGKRIILDMYSTGFFYDAEWIKQWDRYEYKILYEYVDEISEEISGVEIPESSMRRHNNFVKDTDVFMVATAEKLYNEVVAVRGTKNVLFSGNGVDVKHFQKEIDWTLVPKNLLSVLKSGRPIIGYYGAIAIWFDYDLIYKAASERPDYVFLMIGPQYGDPKKTAANVERCSALENVIFTGTIDYKILPHIANNFTVATIPFLLNDITESTSPIKLYEYMAMGKLTVTTAMRECMKHPEVMIAHNAEEYVALLDQAVSIATGPEYPAWKEKLLKVAEANSWDEKAREIMELVADDGR